MMPFAILAILFLGYALAFRRFVPAKTRAAYKASCEKDLSGLTVHLIWIAAIAQLLIAPSTPVLIMQVVGFWIVVSGNALTIAAIRENPWFSATIQKPPYVVRGDVYKLRHPSYIGMACGAFGYFLLLGQAWAVVPTSIYLGMLLYRVRLENKLLYR